ncbi:hypothetical protein [Qipengyuania sp.]|uniref:hypothetical protein n=1 Tax=Qipengyuania sp. TaxID=2004515 RepID=UPI0035C7F76B
MRILFYLPVVTPWWFEAIVTPLIARLAPEHEIHVLAPAPWRNTGIGRPEQQLCGRLPVNWHIVNDPSHPSMRTDPTHRAGLIEFVNSLLPDYVLCRSADCETVAAFPGVVRHIMEAGADPLGLPNDWVTFKESPFDHGLLPDLDDARLAELDRLGAPLWDWIARSTAAVEQEKEAFRGWADLPKDRPTLLLPLEYEHPENFFSMHRVGSTPNAKLVKELAAEVDDSFFLAITNHPLNEKHVDNRALKAAVETLGPRARLFPSQNPSGAGTSALLMREADGLILFDSKIYALAGYLGVPMVRQTRFETGDWLNAYSSFDEFLPAVAEKHARRPNTDRARTWLTYHLANDVVDPNDPDLKGADILARLDEPVDPRRWERALGHYLALVPQVAA